MTFIHISSCWAIITILCHFGVCFFAISEKTSAVANLTLLRSGASPHMVLVYTGYNQKRGGKMQKLSWKKQPTTYFPDKMYEKYFYFAQCLSKVMEYPCRNRSKHRWDELSSFDEHGQTVGDMNKSHKYTLIGNIFLDFLVHFFGALFLHFSPPLLFGCSLYIQAPYGA